MMERRALLLTALTLVVGCGSAARAQTLPSPRGGERDVGLAAPSEGRGACPEGLVGWWRFEEVAGMVRDECGRHHGTAAGSGVERGVPGRHGHAIEFNGTDGYVVVEGAPDLDFLTAGTIDLWVRVPAARPIQEGRLQAWPVGSTVSRGTGNNDNNVPQNTSCGNLQTIFSRDDGSGSTNVTSDCELLPDLVWTHIAVVNDGGRVRLYQDAVLVRETEGGSLGPIVGDLYIGRRSQGLFPLTGALDELRWWTVARTQAEVCEDAGGRWAGSCVL